MYGVLHFKTFKIIKKLTLINPESIATITASLDQCKPETAREVDVQSPLKENIQHIVNYMIT